ncbi:MAG: DUF5615 family PIN-like protein [Candidatus Anammoxibacter sp.]
MIKLYLDEDVHKRIGSAIRLKGYNAVSAHEVKNWNISDVEQLEYAISREMTIFTFNTADFINIHNQYSRKGRNHFRHIAFKANPIKRIYKKTYFVSL